MNKDFTLMRCGLSNMINMVAEEANKSFGVNDLHIHVCKRVLRFKEIEYTIYTSYENVVAKEKGLHLSFKVVNLTETQQPIRIGIALDTFHLRVNGDLHESLLHDYNRLTHQMVTLVRVAERLMHYFSNMSYCYVKKAFFLSLQFQSIEHNRKLQQQASRIYSLFNHVVATFTQFHATPLQLPKSLDTWAIFFNEDDYERYLSQRSTFDCIIRTVTDRQGIATCTLHLEDFYQFTTDGFQFHFYIPVGNRTLSLYSKAEDDVTHWHLVDDIAISGKIRHTDCSTSDLQFKLKRIIDNYNNMSFA